MNISLIERNQAIVEARLDPSLNAKESQRVGAKVPIEEQAIADRTNHKVDLESGDGSADAQFPSGYT